MAPRARSHRKPLSHRELCLSVAYWLRRQRWCDLVSWELAYNDGFVDVIGMSSPLKESKTKIVAVEVKRTKADLVQDLKKGKLLKYESNSTHCYLAATREALGIKYAKEAPTAIKHLVELGLPRHWGILLLPTKGRARPKVLRSSRQIGKPLPGVPEELAIKMAISFSNRILNKKSPLTA